MIVALIGHTGAGKSSCLRALGIDLKLADMDSALGAFDPGWQRTLEWIRATDQTMVAVGVHWSLETLAQIKQRGDCAEQFVRICFVYLHHPREGLHLGLPTAEGKQRDELSQHWGSEPYARFHEIFSALADRTINCTGKSVAEVAAEVLC